MTLQESLETGGKVAVGAAALRKAGRALGKTDATRWMAEQFLALVALRHLVPNRLPLWHLAMLGPRRERRASRMVDVDVEAQRPPPTFREKWGAPLAVGLGAPLLGIGLGAAVAWVLWALELGP